VPRRLPSPLIFLRGVYVSLLSPRAVEPVAERFIDIAAIEQEAAGEPELELGSQPRGSTNLIR